MSDKKIENSYVHGYSAIEQNRLRKQAALLEFDIYKSINFQEVKNLLEVGSGVGAQSEILLRRFPQLSLTGIDFSKEQIAVAEKNLQQISYATNRYKYFNADAQDMEFESGSFDGAFICWVLEHIPNPMRVLSELRRVLAPNSKYYITEVMNSSFFLEPYSPYIWQYWMAFNDFQNENGGDPFIGAKLGNMLLSAGFSEIKTEVKVIFMDNRHPAKRKEMIDDSMELLLSAADQLLEAKFVTSELVKKAKQDLKHVAKDPNAVLHYTFMQASGRV